MKLKLPIIDLNELEDSIIPLDYDDLVSVDTVFYTVDYIQPSINGYSILGLNGYEYTIRMPIGKLEKEIDKQHRIIITEN